MITLNVADYCQDCPYFRAESETVKIYSSKHKNSVIGETVITCEDSGKCERLYKSIAKRTGK